MKSKVESKRLESLDTLRGFDMFFISGGGAIFIALATLFPNPFFEGLATQMEHVAWDGLSFEDLIFPLFLFIAGISFPFSLAKQRSLGISSSSIYLKVVKRGIILVLLGLVYNGILQFDFENQRYCSVLGRIGIAWMFAAIIYINLSLKARIYCASAILIGYWLLLALVEAPDGGGAGGFTMEGSLVGYVDRLITPGRLYLKIHDPEGVLSTVPAIVTAMLGMFTGEWIKKCKLKERQKIGRVAFAGALLLVIGLAWSAIFPINKNLWSSSFVCVTGALSALLFALFYYVIDIKGWTKWTLFFKVIGTNSITIYMMSVVLNLHYTSRFIFGGAISTMPDALQPLLSILAYIAVYWGILYLLYRNRIFLKV